VWVQGQAQPRCSVPAQRTCVAAGAGEASQIRWAQLGGNTLHDGLREQVQAGAGRAYGEWVGGVDAFML